MNDVFYKLKAYGKINLTLDILGKLENGFHEVEMIMQQVSIYDSIVLRRLKKGSGITVSSNCGWLPNDERNLAWKAVEAFADATKTSVDVRIDIRKFIPVSAGMAGGSSDAAAVICGLNRMFRTRLSVDELCRIGENVGSDVPFCIIGGTALATGRGEKLTALPAMPPCHILLAKPRLNVSTPTAYQKFDSAENVVRPDTKKCIEALGSSDLMLLSENMHNVFEDVLMISDVEKLKSIMKDHGAVTAAMSGSGPTVFGIFDNETAARAAGEACSKIAPFTFCCRPVNKN